MTLNHKRGRVAIAALASAVLVLGLAACAGGGETTAAKDGTGSQSGNTKVTVGVLPITAVSPIYLGVAKGFFAKQGLDVKVKTASGGAALVPSIVNGETDFGYSNNVSLLIAASKGLSLKIVSDGDDAGKSVDMQKSTLVVPKNSPIHTPKDLEGKTIAVNTLNNVGGLTIKNSLAHEGVDVSKLKFLQVVFPDMLAALKAGQVDAAFLVPPFVQLAAQDGDRVLAHPFYDLKPGITIASYFTSSKFAQEHPDVVKRFVRGLDRAYDYINHHPAEYAKTSQTFTKISPALLKKIPPETFKTQISRSELELTSRVMEKYGLIDKQPDFDQLIWQP